MTRRFVTACAAATTVAAAAAAPPPAASTPPVQPAVAPAAEERVDRADIDRTTITGHKELPKVLYIVPWKKPLPGDVSARARTSVLDDALAPVERDVFRRQLRYHAQIQTPITPAPQEKTP